MTAFAYFEDDPLSRTVMQVMLTKKLGYTDVSIFENSEDFLAKILALPCRPDVIFLDIHMQPYDGLHVLKTIRAAESLAASKVVALTASVMNEEVELLRNAGFDGIIGKPIDGSTFADLLHRILQGEKVWRPT